MSTWAALRGREGPRIRAHLVTDEGETSMSDGGAQNMGMEMFSPQRAPPSVLQVTRGGVRRSAEVPEDRRNQNQVLERAEMRNVIMEEGKGGGKQVVYFLPTGV